MRIINEVKLDFDDVSLVPRVISEIETRDNIDISMNLGRLLLKCPIIASPMKDVCDYSVAKKIREIGGLGIIHRFCSIDEQTLGYKNVSPYECGCAIGINGNFLERFKSLYEVGCRIFCIDVANGASINVQRACDTLSKYDVDLIVGNVCSKECFDWCSKLPNTKAIRVGIAGGAACTTKNATGISNGMVNSIKECKEINSNCIIIADGGIKEPSDMCKAISFGADCIMLGSSICSTIDSPAEVIMKDEKQYKVYHGSASFEIQKEYKEKPKYIEGKTKLLNFSGQTLTELCDSFCEGLKSSMSYFNATNLQEYKKNVSYVIR